jgi:cyclase
MRAFVLAGIMVLGSTAAMAADSQTVKLEVQHVAGNVYVLHDPDPKNSSSSNVVALIGNDGLLFVNAQEWDESVLSALKPIADKPVRYVIETQCDSVDDESPQRAGATIVAHNNVRKRFELKKCFNDKAALPTLTFESELTLNFDAEDVRLIKLPTGHSDGDVIVYFTKAKVVAMGDMFYSRYLPGYTKYAGGNMLGLNDELHKVLALLPGDVKIIPGMGPLGSMNEVRRISKALDDMRDAIAAQVAKGKTLEQMREMNLLEPWKDLLFGDAWRTGNGRGPDYLKAYFDCLTGPPDPKFQL